jgi:hypothetical protein
MSDKLADLIAKWEHIAEHGDGTPLTGTFEFRCAMDRCAAELKLAVPAEGAQALVTVRDEALEEAAKVVDECNREGPYSAIGAASRIRELKCGEKRFHQSATPPATAAPAEPPKSLWPKDLTICKKCNRDMLTTRHAIDVHGEIVCLPNVSWKQQCDDDARKRQEEMAAPPSTPASEKGGAATPSNIPPFDPTQESGEHRADSQSTSASTPASREPDK